MYNLFLYVFSINKLIKYPDISTFHEHQTPNTSRTTYYVSHKHLGVSYIGFLWDLYDIWESGVNPITYVSTAAPIRTQHIE